MNALARFSTMLVAPLPTLRRVAFDRDGGVVSVAGLYLFVQVLRGLPYVYRQVPLYTENADIVTRRIGRQLWTQVNADLLVWGVAAAALYFASRLWAPHKLSVARALAVVGHAGVWLCLLQMAGVSAAAFASDAWWLPHHPVNAAYALFDGHSYSMTRFAIKCAITYGPSLVVLVLFLPSLFRTEARPQVKTAPVFVVLLLGYVVAAGVQVTGAGRPVGPGDALPDVTLPALFDGDPAVQTGALGAKVTIVDLWASWCAPCKREIPELSALHDAYRDRGLMVLGVNREPRDLLKARKEWEKLAPSFTSVLDQDAGRRSGFGEQVGMESLPTTYVVDERGVVRHVHIGYTEPAVFRAEVEALLGTTKAAHP